MKTNQPLFAILLVAAIVSSVRAQEEDLNALRRVADSVLNRKPESGFNI